MAQPPTPFLGIIPRPSFSEDTVKRVSTKIEDIKKTSMGVVEYFHLLNRGADLFISATAKQVEALQQTVNSDMNEDKKYYLILSTVIKAISLNFTQFGNGLEASLKEYHVVTNVELDQLNNEHYEHAVGAFRKYRQRQDQLFESHKRYIKLQKTFNDSLQAYKQSLSDVKLIYNKEETLKRYQQCEANFKNIVSEEQSIDEKCVKCGKDKREAIYAFNSLGAEFRTAYQFIGEKVLTEAKNIMTLFCSLHKLVVNDISAKKKSLEQTRIGTFLDATPDFLDANRFFKPDTKYEVSKYPIFLEYYEHIKDEYLPCFGRWLNDYQNYLREKSQAYQKVLRKIYGFFADMTKGMERMSLFLIKDVPLTYEKLKKRLQELIGNKSVDFIRCVNSTLEVSMRVYEKLIKVLNVKLEQVDKAIQEETRLFDLFFKELAKQIDPLSKKGMNEETLYESLSEDQRKEHSQSVAQKSQIIKHFLNSFGDKFSKNTETIRIELSAMVNEVFTSFNEIYLYSTEYQQTYFGLDFEEGLKKCRSDMDSLIDKEKVVEVICADMATEEVVLPSAERFKIEEYRAIRKPSSAEDIDKIKEQITSQATDESSLKNSLVKKPVPDQAADSMEGKEKKYFEFLKKKVSMEPEEKLVKTYSCALYDKIILQGKLYVTNQRICFHSYFNAANLFFGSTFLQIPRKDIVKVQKRFNAIIFDNSLAITTVNGEVFFTSFFKRDEAYKLVRNLYQLPGQDDDDEEAKEDEPQENSEESASAQADSAVSQKGEVEVRQPESKDGTPEKEKQLVVASAVTLRAEQPRELGISQQKQQERTQACRQQETRKYKKIFTGEIPNTTCLFMLRHFIIDKEATVGLKKFPSFSQLYKEHVIGSKDIRYEKWIPAIGEYLVQENILESTPMQFKRKVSSTHPLPKTSVPFMPKFCESAEEYTLRIISKDLFTLDTMVQNRGAPYTDSFRVHTRTKYENTPTGNLQITWFLEIEFLKSVMVKSMIESQTTKEFTEVTTKFYKFLTERVRLEQARLHKLQEKRQHIKKENSSIEVVAGPGSSHSQLLPPEVDKPNSYSSQPSPIKQLEESNSTAQEPASTEGASTQGSEAGETQLKKLARQNRLLWILLSVSLLLNLILLIR